GFGPVERLVVLEEMGRVLLCAPYLASAVLAADALVASGDDSAQQALLPGIADGSTIATLAVPEDDGHWTADGVRTRAQRSGERWVLHGQKSFVLDGGLANLVLVVARTEAGPTLFAVDGRESGLSRRALETLDKTRKQAVLALDGVPARLVGSEGAA